jgi:ParB/RepB/Spo0J family partition protein
VAIRIENVFDFPVEKIKIKDRFRVDKGDIEEMAMSLQEKGQIQPIVVDQEGYLLAGERRTLGAKQLGWKTIWAAVRFVDGKVQKLEIELEENIRRKPMHWHEEARLEKAIYDLQMEKLGRWTQRDQAEMRGVAQSSVNQRIQLAEALTLLPELAEHETQDAAWKEFKKLEEEAVLHHIRSKTPEKIKHAPKWAEEHFNVGDAFTGMQGTKAKKADFAEVDPPYAIDLNDRKDRNAEDGPDDEYNEIDADEYPSFFKELASEVHRILKDNSFAIFWYGEQWHQFVFDTLIEVGFKVNPIPAIWYKGTVGQTAQPDIALASCYEPFFLARKGVPRMAVSGRSNVFHFSPLAPSKKIHRTERPVELIEEVLRTILFPGSTCLVPFLGSGATLRAAYKLGHTGFGWDLSAKNKSRFLRKVSEEFGEQEQ